MAEVASRRLEANGLSFMVDEAGEGDDVALFLHGFPESRFSWRHQLPLLAGLGWRAIAPDLRGYGQSSRPLRTADYAIDHLVEDVAGLFEAAGARRRLLVGHDWGAGVAWAFALERRLPLDGLVIMNVPHPAVLARVMRASWRQPLRSWYMAFFQLPGLPEAMMTANGARAIGRAFTGMAVDKSRFPPEITKVYRDNALIPGAMTAMINYYRANTALLGRWREASPTIEVPTLMIWGEEDTALCIENTEGYEGLVSDFTLRRLPGVSHWVQQEAPETVNAILGAWVTDRLEPDDFVPKSESGSAL
ncbi:MAG: epoxide hydrolase [Caulobacteraceae bacterium]|nr:epoxide hydrolase [Caulobacteraceae bacterium]